MDPKPTLDGLLVLDKPAGLTSRDAVDLVVRAAGRRTKAGHAGTLDPLASGVLVVALGAATRLIECVQDQAKGYRAVVRLGAVSDTLDADGTIVENPDATDPGIERVRAALASQVGRIEQVPPQFSALKVQGRRAYDLARQGEPVDLAPRSVRVDRIDLIEHRWPRVTFSVDCGGGTYVRSIARDIGESLGTGGLIEVLVRTRIGCFTLDQAIDPRALDRDRIVTHLLPPVAALGELARVRITSAQAARARHGQPLDVDRLDGPVPSGEVALIDPDGNLVALAEHDASDGRVRPRRVLPERT
jgi:tRNA pseudouridine55 synthase